MGNSAPVPGNTYAELNVQRSNSKVVAGRQSFARHYHLFTIDESKFVQWEYLDPGASKESIATTGRAVGYGPGDGQTLVQFNQARRSQVSSETGASLAIPGGMTAPKARASREERREKDEEKAEKKRKQVEKREEAVAEEHALSESQYLGDIDVCPRCGVRFLTAGGFARHHAGNCFKYTTNRVRESRRKLRCVASLLVVLDELRIAEEQKRLDKLALVTVTLHAKTAGALVGIVLDKEETGGALVVSEVGGLALESARVAVGFVLVRIGGGEVATEGALPRELSAGQKLELTFRRPRPVIPARGAARETIHKEPRFVLHAEQEAYLVEVVLQPLLRGEQPPRPIVVFLSMKSKFGNKMRMDTRTPMWLEKPQIEKWIAEKTKEIKQKKKQPPQSTTPQQEPNSKKAKSAPKKGKAKKKAPPQKEARSSEDDKDDDGDSDEEESDDDGGMGDGDWF